MLSLAAGSVGSVRLTSKILEKIKVEECVSAIRRSPGVVEPLEPLLLREN
jgi:hypothetical protein